MFFKIIPFKQTQTRKLTAPNFSTTLTPASLFLIHFYRFHPKTGQVYRSGSLIHTFPKCEGSTSWNQQWNDDPNVISYAVGILWNIENGNVTFVRGSPNGEKGMETVGTLNGIMMPCNNSSTTISDKNGDKNGDENGRKRLKGLVYPALRTSGMTGIRSRLVTGIPLVTEKIIENTFLWNQGDKYRSTIDTTNSSLELEQKILQWNTVYATCGKIQVENCIAAVHKETKDATTEEKETKTDTGASSPIRKEKETTQTTSPSVQGVHASSTSTPTTSPISTTSTTSSTTSTTSMRHSATSTRSSNSRGRLRAKKSRTQLICCIKADATPASRCSRRPLLISRK